MLEWLTRRPDQTVSTFIYEQIDPVSHAEAKAAFATCIDELIAKTLIAIGLHDTDVQWVQEQTLHFLKHESPIVVSAAITAIGHTVRVNQRIDKSRVLPALQPLLEDPRFAGRVEDVLDDIQWYVK